MKIEYEKNILCPFHKAQHISSACRDPKELSKFIDQKNRSIKCEGLYTKSAIILEFDKEAAKKEHKANFCASFCWQGCPIALMLNKTKYTRRD